MTATTNHSKQHREPLVRISKRSDLIWWKAWLIRLAAIVLAMLVCAGLIVLITGYNPIEVYVSMFKGSFGSARKVWITAALHLAGRDPGLQDEVLEPGRGGPGADGRLRYRWLHAGLGQ